MATAASATTHVLVETPLPWPKDLAATDLHRVVGELGGPGSRVHGVVSGSRDRVGDATIVVHATEPGLFSGYRRRSTHVALGDAPDAVAALLQRDDDEDEVDLLVCGHGSRDRCCGSLGTALAARAAERLGVRVWRSSHLGGHRFAPTALHLPTGTTWAWLDEDVLASIVERSASPSELREHYRGSAAVAHPAAQVAEAEVFAQRGWTWLDCAREAVVHGEPVAGERWDVEVVGDGRRWRAEVAKVGEVPQPRCGDPGPGKKSDAVWRIVDLVESAVQI